MHLGRSRRARRAAFGGTLLLALAFVVAERAEARQKPPTYPDPDWQTADPAEVGMDPAKLQFALNKAFGHVICVRSGWVVGTKGDITKRYPVYSASKAITSLVFGRLLQTGQVSYTQGVPGSDYPYKPMANFRQFLSMVSDYGLDPHAPNQHYAYNNMAYHLLGETLAGYFGTTDPVAVVDQALFQHIGRDDPLTFSGLWGGWNGGFETSARDLARLGYLVLRRGKWKGAQLVPESFIDDLYLPQVPPKATQNFSTGTGPTEGPPGNNWWNQDHLSKELPGNWSFGWWTNYSNRWPGLPKNSIYAEGLFDHRIFVSPDHDLVVVNVFGNGFFNPEEVFKPFVDAVVAPPPPPPPSATVSGTLEVDHVVTVSFGDGPIVGETDPVNPFFDYRLDVTFTDGSQSIVVPGYFAADGDAAQTGAETGGVWRVHFVPPSAGTWTYTASFRTGASVAASPDPFAGTPVAFDGVTGSFDVAPNSAPPGSPRARGRLLPDPSGFPRFERTGDAFWKLGQNSPENILAYEDFDDSLPRHSFGPHVADWQSGEPEWGSGRGRGLIGALDYLASEGVASVAFVLTDVLGGGLDVWPWLDPQDPTRYDVSRLAQWEIVFAHAEELGLHLHLVLHGAGDSLWLEQGNLGTQRRVFLREMVARFGHHLALTWNLGDEIEATPQQVQAIADHLRALDPWDHPIVVGAPPVQPEALLSALVGHPTIDGVSLHVPKASGGPAIVEQWRQASEAAGRTWSVTLDEYGPESLGVLPDAVDPAHHSTRKVVVWRTLFAGGQGAEWFFGYAFPQNDLTLEDFRSRDLFYDQARAARQFLEEVVGEPAGLRPLADRARPPGSAEPVDTMRVFGEPGVRYYVLLETGTPAEILLDEGGVYRVRWFDPQVGGALQDGSVSIVAGLGWRDLGAPPYEPGRDWVCVLERDETYLQWYGSGLAGAGGLVPKITGDDPYLGNLGFHTHLFDAAPSSIAALLVGASATAIPAFGGTILNDAAYAVYLVPTSAKGRASLNFKIAPNPGAKGTSLYFQWLVSDPGAPQGVSMTQGLRALLHEP